MIPSRKKAKIKNISDICYKVQKFCPVAITNVIGVVKSKTTNYHGWGNCNNEGGNCYHRWGNYYPHPSIT